MRNAQFRSSWAGLVRLVDRHRAALDYAAPGLGDRRIVMDGSLEFGGDGTVRRGAAPDRAVVYILMGGYQSLSAELERAYPDGVKTVGPMMHYGAPAYVAYLVAAPAPLPRHSIPEGRGAAGNSVAG